MAPESALTVCTGKVCYCRSSGLINQALPLTAFKPGADPGNGGGVIVAAVLGKRRSGSMDQVSIAGRCRNAGTGTSPAFRAHFP